MKQNQLRVRTNRESGSGCIVADASNTSAHTPALPTASLDSVGLSQARRGDSVV